MTYDCILIQKGVELNCVIVFGVCNIKIILIGGGKLGYANTIARVRSPEYAGQMYHELYLSMTVNPELNAAREIFSLLEIPGVLHRDSFPKGRAEIVEIFPQSGSVLDELKLIDFNRLLRAAL